MLWVSDYRTIYTNPMTQRERTLQEVVERLKAYQPESIILFGSHARGTAGADSDLDIVVVKRTTERRKKRLDVVLNLIYPGKKLGVWPRYGVDILVYTPEELRRRYELGDFFVRRILREGRVV